MMEPDLQEEIETSIESSSEKQNIDPMESKSEKRQDLKADLISTFKEIIIGIVILFIIFCILGVYTWYWPPFAIVESDSMMQSDDSEIGTMDTGDIILIKSIDGRDDFKTYIKGKKSNLKTYNSYGNVIAFKKNGGSETPIIHRAVVWLEYNSNGSNNVSGLENYGSFNVPEMDKYNVMEIYIPDYGPDSINLTINFTPILFNFKDSEIEPHGGLLTKGDNNNEIDQLRLISNSEKRLIEPVRMEWIIGKAEGEIPWLGLIKIYLSGESTDVDKIPPATSVNMLIVTITIIIFILIVIHILFLRFERKRRERIESEVVKSGLEFQKHIDIRLTSDKTPRNKYASPKMPKQLSEDKMVDYLGEIFGVDESEMSLRKRPMTRFEKTKAISRNFISKFSFKSKPHMQKKGETDLFSSDLIMTPLARSAKDSGGKKSPIAPLAKSLQVNSKSKGQNGVPIAKIISEQNKFDETKKHTPKGLLLDFQSEKDKSLIARPIQNRPNVHGTKKGNKTAQHAIAKPSSSTVSDNGYFTKRSSKPVLHGRPIRPATVAKKATMIPKKQSRSPSAIPLSSTSKNQHK